MKEKFFLRQDREFHWSGLFQCNIYETNTKKKYHNITRSWTPSFDYVFMTKLHYILKLAFTFFLTSHEFVNVFKFLETALVVGSKIIVHCHGRVRRCLSGKILLCFFRSDEKKMNVVSPG